MLQKFWLQWTQEKRNNRFQNAIINWHFAIVLWCYTFCMKIQGRKCTLTVLKDNEFIPLPYSEETVRLTSKGYTLPSCIGRRNKLKRIETEKLIQGCFVTRLEYLCTKSLFLLLFYNESSFDFYTDRGFEKIIYKQVLIKGFELRDWITCGNRQDKKWNAAAQRSEAEWVSCLFATFLGSCHL